MKQTLLLFFTSIFIVLNTNCFENHQQDKKGFVIKATLNLSKKTKGVLSSLKDYRKFEVDSFIVTKNGFEFFKEVEDKDNNKVYTLSLPELDYNLNLFISIGDTLIINSTKESLSDISVSGSKLHQEIDEYFSLFDDIIYEIDSIQQKIYYYQQSNKVSSNFLKTLQQKLTELNYSFYHIDSNYITSNISKKIIPYILFNKYSSFGYSSSAIKPYLAQLPNENKNNFYIQLINTMESKKLKVGNTLNINDEVFDTANQSFHFNNIELGKITLIDFWASWCKPCREENPSLVKIYNTYKSKGFKIIGLSLDEKKEEWKKAIITDNLTWENFSDLKGWNSNIVKDHFITFIPYSILIDSDKKIIGVNLSKEALKKKLSEL